MSMHYLNFLRAVSVYGCAFVTFNK